MADVVVAAYEVAAGHEEARELVVAADVLCHTVRDLDCRLVPGCVRVVPDVAVDDGAAVMGGEPDGIA